MSNCCPVDLKPVQSGYQKKDIQMYIAGTGAKGILFLFDIFGTHPNAFQLCDLMAAQGYTVIMPYLFKEEGGWPLTKPIDRASAEWQEFQSRAMNIPSHMAAVEASGAMFRRLGVNSFGTVGLCFGSKVALAAQAQGLVGPVVGIHPSRTDAVDGTNATAPVCLTCTKDEPKADIAAFEETIATKPFAKKCSVVWFEDMFHGFLGARGVIPTLEEYPRDIASSRPVEALKVAMDFFQANL